MARVYLAYGSFGHPTLATHHERAVRLLVAFPFVPTFQRYRSGYNVDHWILDSGAFSVMNSGKTVDRAAFHAAAKEYDPREVYALDVIGDMRATIANVEAAWAEAIPAIPTIHHVSDYKAGLAWLAASGYSGKVAISSPVKQVRGGDHPWLRFMFHQLWPRRIHVFGSASNEALALAPWDSVDASSWCTAPGRTGNFAGYTGKQIRLGSRGIRDLWGEVLEHMRREEWSEAVWSEQLKECRA